jgi:predicted  nucleic acid-binding Zn-ribbon protein
MSLRAADAEEAARPLPQEVQSENAPVSIERLFGDYVEARDDVQRLSEERAADQNQLSDLEQQIRQTQLQYTTEVRPVRSELSPARAKLALCNRALTKREPRRPVKGIDVNAGNKVVQQRYNRALAAFRQHQEQARKEKPGLEQRINQLEAQLATLNTQLTSEQTPLLVELRALRKKQDGLAQQVGAAMSRAEALADALRRVPEDQRLRHDICEWKNTFYSVDELRRILDELKAECDRDRTEMEAKFEAVGRTLPEDWRHPKQDALDALHRLIERATSASK